MNKLLNDLLYLIGTKDAANLHIKGLSELYNYLESKWEIVLKFEKGKLIKIDPNINALIPLFRSGISTLIIMSNYQFINKTLRIFDKVDSATRIVLLRYIVSVPNNNEMLNQIYKNLKDPGCAYFNDLTIDSLLKLEKIK